MLSSSLLCGLHVKREMWLTLFLFSYFQVLTYWLQCHMLSYLLLVVSHMFKLLDNSNYYRCYNFYASIYTCPCWCFSTYIYNCILWNFCSVIIYFKLTLKSVNEIHFCSELRAVMTCSLSPWEETPNHSPILSHYVASWGPPQRGWVIDLDSRSSCSLGKKSSSDLDSQLWNQALLFLWTQNSGGGCKQTQVGKRKSVWPSSATERELN